MTLVIDPGGPTDPTLWCRPIHSAQLYETVALLAAAPVLAFVSRHMKGRPLPHGEFLGFTAYHAIVRFLLEYVPDDAGGVFFGPLSFAQGASLLIPVLALLVLVRNRVRHRSVETLESPAQVCPLPLDFGENKDVRCEKLRQVVAAPAARGNDRSFLQIGSREFRELLATLVRREVATTEGMLSTLEELTSKDVL